MDGRFLNPLRRPFEIGINVTLGARDERKNDELRLGGWAAPAWLILAASLARVFTAATIPMLASEAYYWVEAFGCIREEILHSIG